MKLFGVKKGTIYVTDVADVDKGRWHVVTLLWSFKKTSDSSTSVLTLPLTVETLTQLFYTVYKAFFNKSIKNLYKWWTTDSNRWALCVFVFACEITWVTCVWSKCLLCIRSHCVRKLSGDFPLRLLVVYVGAWAALDHNIRLGTGLWGHLCTHTQTFTGFRELFFYCLLFD